MEVVNLLHLGNRSELRHWLKENHNTEKCCWVVTYRSKCPPEWPAIQYIEVVEEALCCGWIDSTLKRIPDGRVAQRPLLAEQKSLNSFLHPCHHDDQAGRQVFRKHSSMRLFPRL